MSKSIAPVLMAAAEATINFNTAFQLRSLTWVASAVAHLPKLVVEGNKEVDTVFNTMATNIFGSRWDGKLPVFDAKGSHEVEPILLAQESVMMETDYSFIECEFGAVLVFEQCPHYILVVATNSQGSTLVVGCTLAQFHAMSKALGQVASITEADESTTKH